MSLRRKVEMKMKISTKIQSNLKKVIEVENLDATKTKEKRNTWSVNETCALIEGAIEARYDDMYHVHKRKNFWVIISEELGSQNIKASELACKKNGKIQYVLIKIRKRRKIQNRKRSCKIQFL